MALCSNCTIPNRIREFFSVEEIPPYVKQRCNIFHALEALKQNILLKKDINLKLFNDTIEELNYICAYPTCIFLLEVCKLFEKYSCKDTGVIFALLKLIYYSTIGQLWECYERPIMEKNVVNRRYFFKYLYGEDSGKSKDYVWQATRGASVGVLKLMLKFGMRIFRPKSLLSIPYYKEIVLLYLRYPHVPLEYMSASIQKIDSNCNHSQRNRIALVIRAVKLLVQMQWYPNLIKDYVTCYELLFNSINDPYVSGSEVRMFLHSCLPPEFEDRTSEIVEEFKKILPEGNELLQPRTLQHLCRVQIRESLRQNINLPYGVPSLMLPKLLKEYILLNDDGDYSILRNRRYHNHHSFNPSNISKEKDCVLKFLRSL